MLSDGIKPNIYTYTCLISDLCHYKRTPEALKLFEEMIQLGFAPDVFIYTALIAGFTNINKWEKACELFQAMLKQIIKPVGGTYSSLGVKKLVWVTTERAS
ncbi:hypothetical protein HPP92_022636 [Vanilla planifolia]|uniref:Pentatricopeptide repeat-containing protein n=1 Tax=Vanilla planifolia TaxID=51239 RepID=A0A835UC39_VANPL|nr:hypothetical protein HPP92_022636 [Vanilla planifolia]